MWSVTVLRTASCRPCNRATAGVCLLSELRTSPAQQALAQSGTCLCYYGLAWAWTPPGGGCISCSNRPILPPRRLTGSAHPMLSNTSSGRPFAEVASWRSGKEANAAETNLRSLHILREVDVPWRTTENSAAPRIHSISITATRHPHKQ